MQKSRSSFLYILPGTFGIKAMIYWKICKYKPKYNTWGKNWVYTILISLNFSLWYAFLYSYLFPLLLAVLLFHALLRWSHTASVKFMSGLWGRPIHNWKWGFFCLGLLLLHWQWSCCRSHTLKKVLNDQNLSVFTIPTISTRSPQILPLMFSPGLV